MILLAALLACAPGVLEISATPDASGLDVRGSMPLERVEVRDQRGDLVVARSVKPPAPSASMRAPLDPGLYEIRAIARGQSAQVHLDVGDEGPVAVHLEAPLGQDRQGRAAVVEVPQGRSVRAGLVVTAREDTEILVDFGSEQGTWSLVAGERRVAVIEVGKRPIRGVVTTSEGPIELSLTPHGVSLESVAGALTVKDLAVPALPDGRVDPTVPAGRLVLPAPWWNALLDRFGLGFRPRDDLAPRTHVSLAITNHAEQPRNLMLTLAVEDDQGPVHAFRPRLRDASGLATVRRLVRVPAGETLRAALPLYLDRHAVGAGLEAELVVSARWLGSEAMLQEIRGPISVRRGTGWASGALVFGVFGMGIGWLGIAWGLPKWLRWRTRELTTVAVFGSLTFTVGAASQLLGMGVASVLGPFAPFLLGLADDAVRMCLLGALLALVPRPGAFALATLVGWLMRAVALGAVHPVDALYLGNTILWAELLLWLAGVTRTPWFDQPWGVQWLRLVGGLAVPHAVGTLVALAVSVVLYRLYFADWYVVAIVAGPGFLYAAIGCALAVPFAASLRRIG